MQHSIRIRQVIGAASLAAAMACGGSGGYPTAPTPPPPGGGYGGGGSNTVLASPQLYFSPASITITAGQSVTFDFGSVGHNVYFAATAGAPGNITGTNANTSVTRTFNTPGTFNYSCHIHPSMTGTIVVQ